MQADETQNDKGSIHVHTVIMKRNGMNEICQRSGTKKLPRTD